MKQFFKYALATVFGIFLSWIIFFFLIIGIGSAFSGDDKSIKIDDNSVLELNFSAQIFDKVDDDPFAALSSFNKDEEKPMELLEVLENIDKAKDDPKIRGIVLSSGLVGAGSAHISAIRKKLLDFKTSGKFIYAYSDIYTQKGYWLSSVSDSIFLNPVGSLEFKGLAAEITFYKKFQEKFGAKFDVIRHGKFKSAVEPYLADKMSDANRLQTSRLINSIWSVYLNDISKSRNISIEKLNNIADERITNISSEAVKAGLIDQITYRDEFIAYVNSVIGEESNSKLSLISFKDYKNTKPSEKKDISRDQIAVLYAEGEIIYLETGSMSKTVKPNSMVNAIRELRTNDRVKAVVLRVNSPGGSALSSDLIWRELELLKQEKPYVASYGNVAASGGYYISCGADKIFAQENTITGSIGVFGMLPNLEGAAKSIGITSEVVGTNKHAFEFSLKKGASTEMKELILVGVENTYKTFVNKVAEGRKVSFSQVDSIGQGRVWSATDALEIGLVDEIGSLQDAISYVAKKADLESYRITAFPKEEDQLEKLLESFSAEARMTLLRYELGSDAYQIYSEYNSFIKREGLQMRIPYTISIN